MAFLGAAAVSAFDAGVARADTPMGHADITIVSGTTNDRAALEEVLDELLTHAVSVRPHFVSVPRIDVMDLLHPKPNDAYRPIARVFIDLSTSPTEVHLYVTDADSEQVLLRAIPRAESAEVTRETVGQVVETAVDALAHGGHIGITRADAERILVPPPPPPPPPDEPRAAAKPTLQRARTPRLSVGLLYGGQTFAPEHPLAHGPLASLELRWTRGPLSFGPWALVQIRFPIDTQARDFGIHLESACVRTLASAEYRGFRAGIGVGVEAFRLVPRVADSVEGVAGAIDVFAVPLASAALGYRVGLSAGVAALALLTLDGDFSSTQFLVRHGRTEESILNPWPIRVGFIAGIVTR